LITLAWLKSGLLQSPMSLLLLCHHNSKKEVLASISSLYNPQAFMYPGMPTSVEIVINLKYSKITHWLERKYFFNTQHAKYNML